MNANQQQPQPQQPQPGVHQQQAQVQGMPAPPGQPMMGNLQQRFPPQGYMVPPQAPGQAMYMQQQQMVPGQYQQFNNPRGGQGQYRQKGPGQNFPQVQAQNMGTGPQMYVNPMQMGGMPVNMSMGLGQMPIGAQIQAGSAQPAQKKDFSEAYSLYIGNLSDRTFDLDLYKFFKNNRYALASAKVMFDRDTRFSKGFGYLNFYAQDEAERCLKEMNNAVIDGKQVVLNKKKDGDFDIKANVIVKNLPKEMDQKTLSELFSKFGAIKSCKLECFQDGASRGFGYVQFEKAENAQQAIQELNGTTQGGKQIEAMIHSKKDERGEQSEKFTNLFVRNLPMTFTVEQLQELFQEFGQIDSASINPKTPGTGFVGFKDHVSAKNALEAIHLKKKYNDQALIVCPHIYKKENELQPKIGGANPIDQNQKETFKSNVFVRFIPKEVTEEELKTKFSQVGEIASIKLKEHVQQVNGESFSNYQIGYVLYNDVQSAQRCIKQFDESNVFGYGQKPLRVDFWQSKTDIKQEKEQKNAADLKQLINHIMNESKPPYMKQQYHGGQNYDNSGAQNQQMMGDGQKGKGSYNQSGNNRVNGRGASRGGQRTGGNYNKNMNQQNLQQNTQQQQRHQQNQQQYGNNKQMNNQGIPAGIAPPDQVQGQQQNNQMLQNQMQQQQQQQQPMLQLPQIDLTSFDSLQGDDRKNFVGNNIYSVISSAYSDQLASVITGILLDEDIVDFKQLLSNNNYFNSRVNEAYHLLASQQAQQQNTFSE